MHDALADWAYTLLMPWDVTGSYMVLLMILVPDHITNAFLSSPRPYLSEIDCLQILLCMLELPLCVLQVSLQPLKLPVHGRV